MRNLVTMAAIGGVLLAALAARPALGQDRVQQSEIEALRQEIQNLQQRLQRLEQARPPATPPAPATVTAPPPAAVTAPPPATVTAPVPATAALAQRPEEREIQLERENILEVAGLPKPEIGGFKLSAFGVASLSYNSGLQIVPEAFGGTPALADPGRTAFAFNKFGLGVSKVFAPWLSAGAAIEVERHRDRHTHLITNGTLGCPAGEACERFGAEAADTEINLDRFHLTVVAPIGNGLSLSLGRFDVPFGIERHDENLLVTATTSEVFRFGRPQRMTGFQVGYAFAPWLDATAWIVNRWGSEDTGEDDLDENNQGKSLGGRIGFSPFATRGLLNFGIGGWFGSERGTSEDRHRKRWVIDADVTWSPTSRLFFAAEAVYGGEEKMRTLRQVGLPVAEAADAGKDVNWWGLYALGHYDVLSWLGFTFRYGFFEDPDRGRTGVSQTLHSFTFTPVLHLSALIPDLRPMTATVPRTRHPFHWVDLKFEYRLNYSTEPVFGEAQPNHSLHNRASDTSHQVQVQAVVNF
jgi:Putative beta-barrel porin-2, OmpL-like. bbp2